MFGTQAWIEKLLADPTVQKPEILYIRKLRTTAPACLPQTSPGSSTTAAKRPSSPRVETGEASEEDFEQFLYESVRLNPVLLDEIRKRAAEEPS